MSKIQHNSIVSLPESVVLRLLPTSAKATSMLRNFPAEVIRNTCLYARCLEIGCHFLSIYNLVLNAILKIFKIALRPLLKTNSKDRQSNTFILATLLRTFTIREDAQPHAEALVLERM